MMSKLSRSLSAGWCSQWGFRKDHGPTQYLCDVLNQQVQSIMSRPTTSRTSRVCCCHVRARNHDRPSEIHMKLSGNHRRHKLFTKYFRCPQETFRGPHKTFKGPLETFSGPQKTLRDLKQIVIDPHKTFRGSLEPFRCPQKTLRGLQQTFISPRKPSVVHRRFSGVHKWPSAAHTRPSQVYRRP